MSINSLNFCEKLTGELDKVLMQKSATSFMTDNTFRSKFVGANTVLIPDVDFQGLGNYDRDEGFARGAVTVTHTPYTLKMDRARTFSIDREDMDETGVAGLAGQVMGEFVRLKVVPEMDAYVLSNLAKLAADAGQKVTLPSGKTLADGCAALLSDGIGKVQNEMGYDENIVAFVNPAFYTALMATPELSRQIVTSDFKKGEVSTQVQSLNGVSILPVPDSRMKDAYTFNDGSTSGQEAGGFKPAGAAKSIGLLVMPKKACSLVKKTEKTRVFSPDQNQQMDAYKFDYRLYYDAFVKKSLKGTVFTYTY